MKKEIELEDGRFSELVHRQSRFIFRVAYALLKNVYDAEDVVQETFLKIYRSGGWQAMRDERSYLARTAWRLAIDRLPRRVRDVSSDDANFVELVYLGATPEQAAMAEDSRALVQQLMDAGNVARVVDAPSMLSLPRTVERPGTAAFSGKRHRSVQNAGMRRGEAKPVELPKLDVFPTPRPLSPEEKMLVEFVNQHPEEAA